MSNIKTKNRAYFKQQIKKAKGALNFNQLSTQLSKHLKQLPIWKNRTIVATYLALNDELSLQHFVKLSPDLQFITIPQKPAPSSDLHYDFSSPMPDVVLVPGLAFDRSGRRLGRGGGFYDRYLTHITGYKIGVAGSYQVTNIDLPEEEHDIRMDAIATEKFILFPLKQSSFFKGVY